MLVLTRYIGQKIMIGDDIVVEIVDSYLDERGYPQVRVGIQAPKEVPIFRREIWEDMKKGIRRVHKPSSVEQFKKQDNRSEEKSIARDPEVVYDPCCFPRS